MPATYRYLFADLLTNSVQGELPLQGVTFGRRLGKAGNFQGSFGLDYTGFPNGDVLDMTEPGRTALYIERNNTNPLLAGKQLVWGGIIWTRSWGEEGKSLQMTGQTFESFPYQCDLRTTLDYSLGKDQRNVIFDIWRVLQAMTSRNIGVTVPSDYSPNNIVRNNQYFKYGAWNFGKIIEDQQALLNSPDYTIDCAYDINGNPAKLLHVNDVLGNPISQTQLTFDYPGNVNTFWWPENAAQGATSEAGVGAGQDASMIQSLVTNAFLLADGYPDLTQFYTNKDTQTQALLDSQTAQALATILIPITIPTVQLNPELLPQFGSYGLGDYANFVVKSPRFVREGGTRTTTQRIVGWDITPNSSQSTEQVRIYLPGQ